MDELLTTILSCTHCADHLPNGPRPVLQAHPGAKILIAGQAPGQKVHTSGVPFDDASGDRLRNWMGITKELFYDPKITAILPMGFCYPGKGKSGDLPPRKECAAIWRKLLIAQLTQIELTLVIGQYAIAYHLPKTKGCLTEIVKAHRTTCPSLIPLPHPSPRNNIWFKRNWWFERDIIPQLQQRVSDIL